MVDNVSTANSEAMSSDTIYDLEDVINAVHSAAFAADAIIDGSIGNVISDDEVNVAVCAVEHARDAVRTAHGAFHAFLDAKAAAAPSPPRVTPQGGLEDIRQQLEIVYMAASALSDADDQTATRIGLSRALNLLTAAEGRLH